ncbi:PrsW family glutamic-type intramembrane protease [Actinomarinicola tropica]|uniref:PrsW family intramembrane metalloprotease n=1 Tax=Actinomarinicola tropica TaxID=2789776 RepID=A0A5Q2RC59_9ACTN|nr:PrsW family glutamic-type intramembrane protease [Actinomarinicola tropica]QGG94428.1 PrsW family intramembrane metalloprotease [Actinomarinicola tropica]
MSFPPVRGLARLPWRWIAHVSLAVTVVLFALALPQLADGDWSDLRTSALHHGWVLVWLLALSYLARSRSLLNVLGAAMGGFFTAMWISLTVGGRTAEWLGAYDPWQLSFAVPVIEEVAKVVPLLIVILAWRGRPDGSPGAVDLAILGVASGAGFAFHEDALWSRVSGSGFDTPLGWVLPTAHTDAGIVAGHAGWTGMVGLALGIWVVNRRRRWTALLPVAALALAIADHGLWNDPVLRGDWRAVLLDGWLPVVLFLVGTAVALVIETRRVHRATGGATTRLARNLPRLLVRSWSPWNLVLRIVRGTGIIRLSAMTAHQLAWLESGPRGARPATQEVRS